MSTEIFLEVEIWALIFLSRRQFLIVSYSSHRRIMAAHNNEKDSLQPIKNHNIIIIAGSALWQGVKLVFCR